MLLLCAGGSGAVVTARGLLNDAVGVKWLKFYYYYSD